MTLATARRTRAEQIGDIITGLEHAWKMQPTLSFTEILRQLGPEYELTITQDDDGLERALRDNLRYLMSGKHDNT